MCCMLYPKAAKHVHDQCIPGKQQDTPLLCECECDGAGRVWCICMVNLIVQAYLCARIMAIIMLPLGLLKTSFRMRCDMHPCRVCPHLEGQNHWGRGTLPCVHVRHNTSNSYRWTHGPAYYMLGRINSSCCYRSSIKYQRHVIDCNLSDVIPYRIAHS
jgi:hypothetical protein